MGNSSSVEEEENFDQGEQVHHLLCSQAAIVSNLCFLHCIQSLLDVDLDENLLDFSPLFETEALHKALLSVK